MSSRAEKTESTMSPAGKLGIWWKETSQTLPVSSRIYRPEIEFTFIDNTMTFDASYVMLQTNMSRLSRRIY